MLTVAFVLFSIHLLSFTTYATPVDPVLELDVLGPRIPILKRDPLANTNGVVDPVSLGNSVLDTLR